MLDHGVVVVVIVRHVDPRRAAAWIRRRRGRRRVPPRAHEHRQVAVAGELPVPFLVHALEHRVEQVALAPRGRQGLAVLLLHRGGDGGAHAILERRDEPSDASLRIVFPRASGIPGPRRRRARISVQPPDERDDVLVRREPRDGPESLRVFERGPELEGLANGGELLLCGSDGGSVPSCAGGGAGRGVRGWHGARAALGLLAGHGLARRLGGGGCRVRLDVGVRMGHDSRTIRAIMDLTPGAGAHLGRWRSSGWRCPEGPPR